MKKWIAEFQVDALLAKHETPWRQLVRVRCGPPFLTERDPARQQINLIGLLCLPSEMKQSNLGDRRRSRRTTH
jgi:hypothetical protein